MQGAGVGCIHAQTFWRLHLKLGHFYCLSIFLLAILLQPTKHRFTNVLPSLRFFMSRQQCLLLFSTTSLHNLSSSTSVTTFFLSYLPCLLPP
uniref:Uncharacterized protein n=1 Tax=Octopus bimaculoides TaxID=37653 RepID=A0A0L8GZW2_OCTBM